MDHAKKIYVENKTSLAASSVIILLSTRDVGATNSLYLHFECTPYNPLNVCRNIDDALVNPATIHVDRTIKKKKKNQNRIICGSVRNPRPFPVLKKKAHPPYDSITFSLFRWLQQTNSINQMKITKPRPAHSMFIHFSSIVFMYGWNLQLDLPFEERGFNSVCFPIFSIFLCYVLAESFQFNAKTALL